MGTISMDDSNFDMNDFVNFDQGFVAGSPTTPSVKVEPRHSTDGRSAMDPPSSQRMYNGPSHDYGQFRQQTGLPMGAVSHVKAVNAYSNQMRPSNLSATTLSGYNAQYDVDFDHRPSNDMTAYFYPMDSQSDDFAVDPSAIAPDAQPINGIRAWPGMHSQQAKVEAAAKEAEIAAQQQRRDQQLSMQRPLPTNFQQSIGDKSQPQHSSEPEVNDQIARLLNHMRHQSDTSHVDDDNESIAGDGLGSARLKKDEDEMDEDERLLASEEGKKLTSKERRQLRNKVSARAFRSRRKEYITQLEGEVALKVSENNELKNVNRHLLEQNRQLTQLTRTMLGHPAFSTFMQDMSNDPTLLNGRGQNNPNQTQTQTQNQSDHHQQQRERSDAPQQDRHQSEATQVGMSMIPENNLDMSMLNLGANHWGGGNFTQPQIYAVHDLPVGPPLEELRATHLSGKAAVDPMSLVPSCPKVEVPEVEFVESTTAESDDDTIDPCFVLYVDSSSTERPKTSSHPKVAFKVTASSNTVTSLSASDPANMPQRDNVTLQTLDSEFAALGSTLDRIAAITFRLPR